LLLKCCIDVVFGKAAYTVSMYYTIFWSSHKVVRCTWYIVVCMLKKLAEKKFVRVLYISNLFKNQSIDSIA